MLEMLTLVAVVLALLTHLPGTATPMASLHPLDGMTVFRLLCFSIKYGGR